MDLQISSNSRRASKYDRIIYQPAAKRILVLPP
jgi:hypothetical protein